MIRAYVERNANLTTFSVAAMNPAKLIHAVRSTSKGERVKSAIAELSPQIMQEVWHLDLASLDSVLGFATKAARELDRLDILLLNAGVALSQWSSTKDGYETT